MADRSTDRKRKILLALLPEINSFFNENDDSDDDGILLLASSSINKKTDNCNKRICIKNYVENVVMQYPENVFKSHFRLKKSTVEVLVRLIEPELIKKFGRPPIPVEKALLSIIWLLANQESFRSVADRFDLAKSTLFRVFYQVSNILVNLAKNIIKWPSEDSYVEVEAEFKSICGFPGIIGAIDGTHISINKPKENAEKYYNRKKYFSIVLQGVATNNLCFTHVFCAYPGAVHDARIYANSEIATEMCGKQKYFPNQTHLIGDPAYPLGVNQMVPYKNNGHLSQRQINFNKALSKSRVCVERAFGLLKGRFRRLKHFEVIKIENLPLYIVAACVLHNICIKEHDFVDYDCENDDAQSDIADDIEGIDVATAINKRDYICGILPNI